MDRPEQRPDESPSPGHPESCCCADAQRFLAEFTHFSHGLALTDGSPLPMSDRIALFGAFQLWRFEQRVEVAARDDDEGDEWKRG